MSAIIPTVATTFRRPSTSAGSGGEQAAMESSGMRVTFRNATAAGVMVNNE
jgi:hypothetical protein